MKRYITISVEGKYLDQPPDAEFVVASINHPFWRVELVSTTIEQPSSSECRFEYDGTDS